MNTDTKDQLESAIAACAAKAEKTHLATEAQQLAQAALNLANALILLDQLT